MELYKLSLTALDQHPDAVIPIERAQGRVLLVCGEADTLWPSCPMSRAVEQRARERGGDVTVLAYPDAGHLLGGPPPEGAINEDTVALGGTVEGMRHAYEDSWPRVLAFLDASLAG